MTEADVQRLEQRLGLRLPGDYRTWLRENNGAYVDSLAVREGVVNSFRSVLDTYDGGGLGQTEEGRDGSFDAWVPPQWLPVSGGTGGTVCVKVAGDDVGSVWWADFDLGEEVAPRDEREDDSLPQIMERLADSWTSFLADYEEPALSPEFLAYLDSLTPQDP